jgi:hypothetical protein
MFVPHSVRRIRFARTAFLLGGLLPCVALAAWSVHRHSAAHRETIRREWEQAVGLPIAVAAVEHPLPGAIRARGCGLTAADGRPALAVERADVVTSPTEVRLAIAALDCDPAGAAVLAGLAAEWLARGARFRRDVVIDVAEFAWRVNGVDGRPERRPLGPVRIECVAQGGDRAVRVVRRAADAGQDEVRIVWSAADDAVAAGGRFDVDATCTEPVPAAILAAIAAHTPIARVPVGAQALFRGRLSATSAGGRQAGTATGRLERVDLAACTAALAAGALGTMDVDLTNATWRDGRLESCEFTCDASAGRIDRRLLESLVTTVGCRPGPAYVHAAVGRDAAFEAFGCRVKIDGRGLDILGSSRLGGAIAAVDGRSLVDPPAGVVSPERLAWLLASPGAVYVPSSGAGGWLMSLLPAAGGAVERTSRAGTGADGGF